MILTMHEESEHPATSRKTEHAQNARFASATTCSFGINPRSSLHLAFRRDSPELSHRDFSSLSDPAALTAPHCVQKNTFSWPCNRASRWLTCMIPGKFSFVRGAWLLRVASAAAWLISGCATSLRFASRWTLLSALDWRQHVSRFRFFLLLYVVRNTNSTPEGMRCAV